ncbi:MAG TPA: hypothetical protein VFE41_30670 [Acetobacteraceae bacterium]|nr:hypothetical protein [Acetobacteraceae bacterium]
MRPLENPDSAPVNVRVALTRTVDGDTRAQAMSLYPPDQPATFVVRVPRMAAQAQISVTLLPGTTPLAVAVGPLVWRYEEPK